MASREISSLSKPMQVLYNKFFDKVRRDTDLQRQGVTVLLICTYRKEERGHTLINRTPSEAFEVIALRHGRVEPILPEEVANHAESVGLKITDSGQFEAV